MKLAAKVGIGAVIALAVLPLLAVGGLAVSGVTPLALGAHDPVQNDDGTALGGYDVVSLFEAPPGALGTDAHTMDWHGATWRFASAENLAKFQAAPAQYMPQCGGYCAFAATKGFAAASNPSTATIVDGKLFVFAEADVKDAALSDADTMEAACANFQ